MEAILSQPQYVKKVPKGCVCVDYLISWSSQACSMDWMSWILPYIFLSSHARYHDNLQGKVRKKVIPDGEDSQIDID